MPILSVSGNRILKDQAVYQLRGCNLSGLETVFAQHNESVARPWGYAMGSASAPPYSLMRTGWAFTCVRIPLNQASWLGVAYNPDGTPYNPDQFGIYRATVDAAIVAANAAGLGVILDVHWSLPFEQCLTQGPQGNFADSQTLVFLAQLATRYANNRMVMIELYNEPICTSSPWGFGRFPYANEPQALLNGGTITQYHHGDNGPDWVQPWQPDFNYVAGRSVVVSTVDGYPLYNGVANGLQYLCNTPHLSTAANAPGPLTVPAGTAPVVGPLWTRLQDVQQLPNNRYWVERPWTFPGWQAMVNAIRATGARNIVIIGAPGYTQTLANVVNYLPTDSANQLAVAWHVYPSDPSDPNCLTSNQDPASWTAVQAILDAGHPMIVTELGGHNVDGTVGSPLTTRLTTWADQNMAGVIAWSWNPYYNGGAYSPYNGSTNILVRDSTSWTPTDGFGRTFQAWSLSRRCS